VTPFASLKTVRPVIKILFSLKIYSLQVIFSPGKETPTQMKKDHRTWLRVLESSAHGHTLINDNTERRPGLSREYIWKLVELITSWPADGVVRKKRKTRGRGFPSLFHTITALDLVKTSSSRLLSCLVPNEHLDGDLVQTLLLWTSTNCSRLSIKFCIEPVLRWTNLLLQYHVVPLPEVQKIYELFIQMLGFATVVSCLSLSLLFQAFFRQYNLFKHYVYMYIILI
jgi:hypothetical protein